jgi:hypothetical protein
MKTTTLTISHPISDSLLRCALNLIPFVLICVSTLPGAHAVSPPPDGGYPNFNTAEGQSALFSLTTGSANTAVGWFSLSTNAAGSFNTATGAGSLLFNTADQNTAFGAAALLFNSSGFNNTAVGAAALSSNTTGSNNTAYGEEALENSNNNHNTAVGSSALRSNTTGSVNTALGSFAGINVTTADHVICIGINGDNVSNSCFIGNIFGETTVNANIPVMIDSAGQLGTTSSSRRFKKEIQPMDKASESLLALKPVTFHYKSDNTSTPQFGLIAEEVADINPDLVVRDKKGEIYTVRYDAVNAMLLNEFLKEHRKVQEQEATITKLKATATEQEARATKHEAAIAQQQKQIEALTAGLQKVSAQLAAASPSRGGLEASKPAPQVVTNNQ